MILSTTIRSLLCVATLLIAGSAVAQDVSTSSAVMRRSTTDTPARRGSAATGRSAVAGAVTAATPQVSERMQNRLETSEVSDADKQWMRVIYRKLDLDKAANTPLYYPVDLTDGQENLIRIIFRLFASGAVPGFEFLDGREVFNETFLAKPRETLSRFGIPFAEAKGSTDARPMLEIDEYDVPAEAVKSYYIIERWEFDSRNNALKQHVDAICPVWQRIGDDGVTMPTPLFWIRYNDLKPYINTQTIFVSDDNNLPTCTIDDFFELGMYDGEIYKTRNLRNLTLNQIHGSEDAVAHARDSIQQALDNYENKLWVPSLDELQARAEGVDAQNDSTSVVKTASRPTRSSGRPAAKAKPKQKVKTAKPKSSGASSGNAARSVRNRKR